MKPHRILEIDGLRALAISAVLLYHFLPSSHVFLLGWMGVDLFFVISGFLITGILLNLRSDPTPYRKFYWRRAIRIFPPYYAVLALIALCAFANHERFALLPWIRALTFLPAIRIGIDFHLIAARLIGHAGFDLTHQLNDPAEFSSFTLGLGPYWSLAVEELFYLLWAPIILKGSRRVILGFAIAPLIICPALRFLTHTAAHREYYGFLTRFDTLVIGSWIALLFRSNSKPPKWMFVAPIPVLLASLAGLCIHCGLLRNIDICSYQSFCVFGYDLVALLFACIVAACVQWEKSSRLSLVRLRPVVYLGTISYTVYLSHYLVGCLVARFVSNEPVRAFVALALTIALAALSWEYFESRMLLLRNWSWPQYAISPAKFPINPKFGGP